MEAMGKDAEDADYLMENVAIATIGDVMDLVDENRIFVKQGTGYAETDGESGTEGADGMYWCECR